MVNKQTVAILGAGSWGTAVAIHLAHAGHRTILWSHRESQVQLMQTTRSNTQYLVDVTFPERLEITSNLEDAVNGADAVIIAVPSHAFVSLLDIMPKPQKGVAWLTKGIDPNTQRFLSEHVADVWGHDYPIAVISGPSFAKEVATRLPTAITIASQNSLWQAYLRDLLHQNQLRVYLSDDEKGVQICGAVKNVLAIACGISDGLGFGANAKAALITRGLAEMTRLGLKLGANLDTFLGLAGVGDLVLTCTDNQSRNRRFGLLLGQGINTEQALSQIAQVVEGLHNAKQVCQLAHKNQVDMPICEEVLRVLNQEAPPRQAFLNLMNRPPKEE